MKFEFKFLRAIDAHGVKPWAIAVCAAVSGRDCARPCMAQSEAIDRGAQCDTCVWQYVVLSRAVIVLAPASAWRLRRLEWVRSVWCGEFSTNLPLRALVVRSAQPNELFMFPG